MINYVLLIFLGQYVLKGDASFLTGVDGYNIFLEETHTKICWFINLATAGIFFLNPGVVIYSNYEYHH